MHRIRDAVAELVDDLATHTDVEDRTDRVEENSPLAQLEKAETKIEEHLLPERWRVGKPVLCIPGPSLLDEALAVIVTQLLEQRGVGARAEQADALSMSRILSWDTGGIELICLCYIEAATAAQIRYAIRRIRRRVANVAIIVAFLEAPMSIDYDEAFSSGTESVQDSLRATIDKVMAIASTDSEEKTSEGAPVVLAG
jgi:hypothetical protein